MINNTETTTKIRKSIVCTFSNHAPIRFWGEFEITPSDDPKLEQVIIKSVGQYTDDYTDTLWDGRRDFGHHDIEFYTCKSGKRIYFASYNSGESYGSHSPRTTRTYLKDAAAIKAYFGEMNQENEWYRVCGIVDPALIVDSDLL